MNTTTTDPEADNETRPRALCRPIHDRILAGVAAGIANYLDIDVTVVRMALAVLTFVGGAGVAIYLAGWLLMPEEGSEESIASAFIRSHHLFSH
jgi:phage shock protein PspC (stress-responsive transcriptional regulator)